MTEQWVNGLSILELGTIPTSGFTRSAHELSVGRVAARNSSPQ